MDQLSFELEKNNVVVQSGNTALMLWKIDELIYVSQFFTLKIGDIIFTGTPAGVGPVVPNNVLVGRLEEQELFRIKVK